MKVFLIILIFLLQSFPSSAKVGDVYVCNLKKGFAFMGKDFNDLFDSPLPKHRENAKTKLVWLEKSIKWSNLNIPIKSQNKTSFSAYKDNVEVNFNKGFLSWTLNLNEEKNKFFQILLYDCSDIFKK